MVPCSRVKNLHFDNERLVFGKLSIQLSWIFGEKAFLRYKSISNLDENVFAKRRKITHDLGLDIFQTIGDLKGSDFYRNSICLPKDDEEIEKNLFYNTIEGYYWCNSNTSLYNHRSMKCAFGKFQKRCKLELKKTSPEVYKMRGYHE
jgi:hypothetical protein